MTSIDRDRNAVRGSLTIPPEWAVIVSGRRVLDFIPVIGELYNVNQYGARTKYRLSQVIIMII